MEAHASDLNPVAVLITKALVEIPPKFTGYPPVNPDSRKKLDHSKNWQRAQGLAEDVRYYGQWILDEAKKRIGYLYPKVQLPQQQGGGEGSVNAWVWARTVQCNNPACGFQLPLTTTFKLSLARNSMAWVQPSLDKKEKLVRFEVRNGAGAPNEGTVNRHGATCLACGTRVPLDYVRAEGKARRMGTQLMAIVAEGSKGRVYVSPDEIQVSASRRAEPSGVPETDLPDRALSFRVQLYGMTKHRDLFTPRQLVAMTTFSELIDEMRKTAIKDASGKGVPAHVAREAEKYADALSIYLACAISRLASYSNTICHWNLKGGSVSQIFSRHAIPMSWDFIEVCPFASFSGNWAGAVSWVADVLDKVPCGPGGVVSQLDASAVVDSVKQPVVVTDPPYYDNIGYADLSDFFYIWLRRSLGKIVPDLFSTVLVPKQQELVANPHRFGESKERAKEFFEEGFAKAFAKLRATQHPDFPLAVFYAFKQSEIEENSDGDEDELSNSSTGWETILSGLLTGGFSISGTWPIRSEKKGRMLSVGTNALASSIVLVCRPRSSDAALATRREFLNLLKRELPVALRTLQQGNIAPVDLAQASIGPGMAVFSRYAKVLEADGSPMNVRTALGLINQVLDEVLAEQESEFDADTRWAIAWFEQFGMEEASFGVAETLSKAKNTAVNGLVEAGILAAKLGKVRLLTRSEMRAGWDPATDRRLTIWEVTQHLIRALEIDGETGAADLLRKLGSLGEVARDLAYRLFSMCERKKWAQEALAYNSLVVAWPEIARLAKSDKPQERQATLNL